MNTGKEIEKIAVEIANACSYEHYKVGDESPGVKKVIKLLTAYGDKRAKEAAKEERKEMLKLFTEMGVADIYLDKIKQSNN